VRQRVAGDHDRCLSFLCLRWLDLSDLDLTVARSPCLRLDRIRDVDCPACAPLVQGLQANLDGWLGDAEEALQEASRGVPDSLRLLVYERLLAINQRGFNGDDVVRYRTRATGPRPTLGSSSNPIWCASSRIDPSRRLRRGADTTPAPFERLQTERKKAGTPPLCWPC